MDVNTHLECLELRIFGILTRFLSVEGGAPRHPSRGSYSAHRHLQVSHYTFIQVASAEGLSIFGLITFAVTSNWLWDSFVSIAKDALTILRPSLTQFIWQKEQLWTVLLWKILQRSKWHMEFVDVQSGRSSLAKHGGAYFSAVYGFMKDPIAVPGLYENQEC